MIRTIVHEHHNNDNDGERKIVDGLTDSPSAVITIILTFSLGWGLLSLLSYHCWLLSIGQTTNEQLRDVFNDEVNPYDKGCCENTRTMMCKAAEQSMLPDMSEMMSAREYIETNHPTS